MRVALGITIALWSGLAPADVKFRQSTDPIPDQYVVVLSDTIAKSQVAAMAEVLTHRYGGVVATTWEDAIRGFAISLPEAAAIALSQDPRVKFVEENARIFAAATQNSPPWHLDRIDQTTGLNGNYHYCSNGSYTTAYVIDTGVWRDHSEFVTNGYSRVQNGADFATWDGVSTEIHPCAGTDNYAAGHGTSVASILAGNTFGIAKNASIVPVRVFDCNAEGTVWQLVSGLEWVYDDWTYYRGGTAVVNMSLFFRVGELTANELNSVEHAVEQLLITGVQVVASANNQNADACTTTPARMADVVTVAGTADNDERWVCDGARWTCGSPCFNQGSNFGTCVNVFAPARYIRSAHILNPWAERGETFPGYPQCDARSGTSFAAPVVAGTILRYLSEVGYRSPTQIRTWLYTNGGGSNDNIVTNQGAGSPRRFVYKDAGGTCP